MGGIGFFPQSINHFRSKEEEEEGEEMMMFCLERLLLYFQFHALPTLISSLHS